MEELEPLKKAGLLDYTTYSGAITGMAALIWYLVRLLKTLSLKMIGWLFERNKIDAGRATVDAEHSQHLKNLTEKIDVLYKKDNP